MGLSCMTGCTSKNDDKTSNTSSIEIQDESTNAVTNDTEAVKPDNQYADTLTLVWYPNESADTYSDIYVCLIFRRVIHFVNTIFFFEFSKIAI